jgi:hypothetical protein
MLSCLLCYIIWGHDDIIFQAMYFAYERCPSQGMGRGSKIAQPPFLPELELLLTVHPVAAVTVGLVV